MFDNVSLNSVDYPMFILLLHSKHTRMNGRRLHSGQPECWPSKHPRMNGRRLHRGHAECWHSNPEVYPFSLLGWLAGRLCSAAGRCRNLERALAGE